ncbi:MULTISPECIES: menaquinone-dependent protoporphyrinogen IX dehydrogenase [unclassified Avibacterium]|uniref:menaquinone-dependent protoporphyrinogen IX dehydrogenase n=1 Tax=unclassified Avibacterium TaxID=2685287 RepID=UPI002026F742|nr:MULTISPECIES: menaquinone-dependent protoporphyrinogen IX dehydrogenase [unclassified Avibacterium]MCW9699865.1 menaquinone-dependent protoporphyrinogen IX dehydrogenase [Avibacterium sp. 20-129]MCW9733178.1 menaquinone-dependent protoporphyrinogen IX dehydrogenase [Avibacterium sp. 20-15]URL05296.1 menaquinone-dependent protoporphyrinogen IX dehydrogenase [Avibacterium sp. 20-132]
MKTLILYSSCDGQTQKIAQFMAEKLIAEVRSISDNVPDLAEFDRIIIGASIRYGHFNKLLYQFIEKNTALLNRKQTAFFGVNLTARKAGKDTPETNSYVKKFLQRIHWNPTLCAVFAGALLYPRYGWFDRMMIRFIMKITGGETDTSKEIEYTDWQKVDKFAEQLKQLN